MGSIIECSLDNIQTRINNTSEDEIYNISIVVKIRGNNSYGAKVLSEENLTLDSELNIIPNESKGAQLVMELKELCNW